MGKAAEVRALLTYLDRIRGMPFEWGVHDCLLFTNTAWRKMYGAGWADDWIGLYVEDGVPRSLGAFLSDIGYPSLEEAFADRLTPIPSIPPRGALVMSDEHTVRRLPVSLGISLGAHAAFLGRDGLEFRPVEKSVAAWGPK